MLLGGVCDGVALGRELLRNPYFAFGAMKEFGEDENIENAYKRAYSNLWQGETLAKFHT